MLAGLRRPSSLASRLIHRSRELCTPASTSEPLSPLRRVIASYEAALESRPLLTKSVTSGTLYGLGDIIAQKVAQSQQPEGSTGFDGARWLRAVAFGGLFYPLPAHFHYNFLER